MRDNARVTAEDWIDRDAAVVWHGFTQMAAYPDNAPVIVERAEGHELIDVDGRRYLDAVSSLWLSTLGHRVPELDDALRAQLDRVAHSTMLGNGNRIVIELAESLARVVPVDDPRFLFASDGASAVEQALRIAFQHWHNLGVAGRTQYLAFGDAYHGDTIGALSLGAGGFGTDLFDPLRFPVLRAPSFADPSSISVAVELIGAHADTLAAVVVEPLVQAAGGVLVVEPDDMARLARACRDHGVLLICDEIVTGFGRTGTLFASDRCGIRPDLLCLGKGMTAGYLPMSATVVAGAVAASFLGPDLSTRTLFHGHSYGGNALAAAVALRHLQLLDERDILTNVEHRSAQLHHALVDRILPLPGVRDVRTCGLIAAVELEDFDADPLRARRTSVAAVGRGVLLRSLGPNILVVPPLSISALEIDRVVDTLALALADAVDDHPVAADD